MSERDRTGEGQDGSPGSSRAPSAPPIRIFINYRREDAAGHAGRLYDSLAGHFGPEQLFMDIDTIEPGVDFTEVINEAVGSCDVLISVIGREWLHSMDERGRTRLDNPDDFVRLEIQAALDRRVRVIPALVLGAAMPSAGELPDPLGGLARRNAIEISDTRWHYDVGRLIRSLEKLRGEGAPTAAGAPAMVEHGPPAAVGAPEAPTEIDRQSAGFGVAPQVERDDSRTAAAESEVADRDIARREPLPTDLGEPRHRPGATGGEPPVVRRNLRPLITGAGLLVVALAVVGGLFALLSDDEPSTTLDRTVGAGVDTATPSSAVSASPAGAGQGTALPGTSETGTVVFEDTFAMQSAKWCRGSNEISRASYKEDTYRILVKPRLQDAWCIPRHDRLKDLTDTGVQVDAGRVAGPRESAFGVICRWVDKRNSYVLYIDGSDGFYSILKLKDGRYITLSKGVSDRITTGSRSYSIRAECTGGTGGEPVTLSLIVDGELIEEVRDRKGVYRSGSVGLVAGTWNKGSVVIRFDNFLVVDLT